MRNTYLYLIIVFSLILSACDSGEDYDNSAFFNISAGRLRFANRLAALSRKGALSLNSVKLNA